MPKYAGYLLNSDQLAAWGGASPRVVCGRCYARAFGVNRHRAPRPHTRRMLGIVPILRTDAGAPPCTMCGAALSGEARP